MAKRIIRWAGREKRRQTSKAIAGSLFKTITELVTNSDSAIKKQLGVPHATGLVDAMLGLSEGDLLDTAALKDSLAKRQEGRVIIQLYTKQHRRIPSRTCQVIDYGPGMTEDELNRNFDYYAGAKAKGERTRSLFGRGALDVFLSHSNQRRDDGVDASAHVFSVSNGTLSYCRISWESDAKGEEDSIIETQTLGPASPQLFKKHDLPPDLLKSGTVVRFLLGDEVRIPHEDNILSSMSNFYMLRLIGADPFMNVQVERYRTEGKFEGRLSYDFDVGTVLKRTKDTFRDNRLGEIPVDILVARSNRKMKNDPFNYERRENGLLFVDDNDAALDLTLLPEYDKNPLLSRIYGIVRLTGIRNALEKLLEAQRPEAVLTETREGFDTKSDIVRALFALIEKHVKPIYDEEEKRERKGGGHRSAELERRLKEALRELNKFHNEETDEEGTGHSKREPAGPLEFAFQKIRLVAGQDRRVILYAERDLIHSDLNEVEITSSNPRVRAVPESEIVSRRKGSRFQSISITLSCAVARETAIITAQAFNIDSQLLEATLSVTDVTEPQQVTIPVDLEFRPIRYNGKPNVENQIVLLVNLDAFPGMPVIKLRILTCEGTVTLGSDHSQKFEVKVEREWIIQGTNIAKVVIPYWATAWGAKAEIQAKAKRTDGKAALARCKVDFREERGPNQYEDIYYEELDRPILGEALGKYIYVNSKPPLHQTLFGDSQESFDKAVETEASAQMRVAGIVSDAVVYTVASKKYQLGGEKGLDLGNDPITAIRSFVEEKRYELDSKIVRAFLKEGPQ